MDALTEEQTFVDAAYARLDELSEAYTQKLEAVRKSERRGNPEELFQRDSFAADFEDNLRRLRQVEHQLVLGRLDYEDTEADHIGRIGLRSPDREVLLLDWRAPQAEPFYQATALNPRGVIRRRHIQTRFRDVISVEDELLNADAVEESGLTLAGEGALMAALNTARDGRMSDIVTTIQAEQDRIIRADATGVLVVQGGPGTGKTAVALHRAAYLLYTHRQRLSRSGVLVIGPTHDFLSYIGRVLPSLGESDVVSSTLGDLLPGITATGAEDPAVSRLKGRTIWTAIAQRAVRSILRKPLEETVMVTVNSRKLPITPADVEAAQRKALRSEKPHNEAREIYARAMVDRLIQVYQDVTGEEEPEWLRGDIASNKDVRREVNLRWLPSTPLAILERLYARPHLLELVAPEFSDSERAQLQRDKGSPVTEADVPILDEFAELLGEIYRPDAASDPHLDQYMSQTMSSLNLGGGIVSSQMMVDRMGDTAGPTALADRAMADRQWTYGHVVVDEAQELSPLAWKMVARRCPTRSMTIVGDLDQRPEGAPSGGWRELLGDLGEFVREEVLTISYRTPGEILDEAERKLEEAGSSIRHPVTPARYVEDALRTAPTLEDAVATELDFLDEHYGPGRGLLTVITPLHADDDARRALASNERFAVEMDGRMPRLQVMTARAAKGLEFDSVIVSDEASVAAGGPGDLYVAMTRPTQHLTGILAT